MSHVSKINAAMNIVAQFYTKINVAFGVLPMAVKVMATAVVLTQTVLIFLV